MKFKILFILISVLSLQAVSSAGPDKISHIKKLYKEASDLDCGRGCEHCNHSITLNTMMPGTGLQTIIIKFTFNSLQKDPEKDPYLLHYRLYRVTVTYNIAASENYRIEYLYDEKANPVFYYWQNQRLNINKTEEKRLYFNNNALIQVIAGIISDSGKPDVYTMTDKFRNEDLKFSKFVLKKAEQYKKLFREIIAAEQIK